MVKLRLHADDLGATLSHSRAIVRCFDAGALDSASLLVTHREALPETLELLASRPQLGLRLHLNLSEGRPLCPPDRVPLLCRGGALGHNLWSLGWLWLRWGTALERQLGLEIEAQREAFASILKSLGRPAEFAVDCHEHLDLLPFVSRQLRFGRARAGRRLVYFADLPSRAFWAHRLRACIRPAGARQLWTGTVDPRLLPDRLARVADVEVLFHPCDLLRREDVDFLPTRRHREAYLDPARRLECQLLLDRAPMLRELRSRDRGLTLG